MIEVGGDQPLPAWQHRELDVLAWGLARNLIGPTGEATRHGQVRKTLEEAVELLDGINKDDRKLIKDAIGDIVVTLYLQCALNNMTLSECIEAAWQEIKDRKGRMIGGIFVKEA